MEFRDVKVPESVVRRHYLGSTPEKFFWGWLEPGGDVNEPPTENSLGVWKRQTLEPTGYAPVFRNKKMTNFGRIATGREKLDNHYTLSVDNELNNYSSEGSHQGYWSFGLAREPKPTFWGYFIRQIVHGRLMGYPWNACIAFAWRYRNLYKDRQETSLWTKPKSRGILDSWIGKKD